MERSEERRFQGLSPFELKNKLVELAKHRGERLMLNAGARQSELVALAPRAAFFRLGEFAVAEAGASRSARLRRPAEEAPASPAALRAFLAGRDGEAGSALLEHGIRLRGSATTARSGPAGGRVGRPASSATTTAAGAACWPTPRRWCATTWWRSCSAATGRPAISTCSRSKGSAASPTSSSRCCTRACWRRATASRWAADLHAVPTRCRACPIRLRDRSRW